MIPLPLAPTIPWTTLRSVSVGPDNPVWVKLYGALSSLAVECEGKFAFVIDVGNGLWCVGLPDAYGNARWSTTPRQDRAADRFYRDEMTPRLSAIRRGSRMDVAKVDGDDRYYACSFAGIYVVVVWFDRAFDPVVARAMVRRALPEIESLTLALPPSTGPGCDAGAMKARA